MPQSHSLLELLRTRTGSDDLLRTLLKAQAAHSQAVVQSMDNGTAIRVVALDKGEPVVQRGRQR